MNKRKPKSKLTKVSDDVEMVYFITKYLNDETYFVAGTKDADNTVMWTTRKKNALQFQTESAVRYYIVNRMNARTDVFVTKADKEE